MKFEIVAIIVLIISGISFLFISLFSDRLIHLAAKHRMNGVTLSLVSFYKDSINTIDKSTGQGLLTVAFANNDYFLVESLLQLGADVNLRNRLDQTVVDLVFQSPSEKKDILYTLFERGAETDRTYQICSSKTAKLCKVRYPLFYAYETQNWKLFQILLDRYTNLDVQLNGKTLLHHASVSGNITLVKQLVEGGATVDLAYAECVYTPSKSCIYYSSLLLALDNKFEDIAMYLIDHGAITGITDRNGLSPFQLAILNNHYKLSKNFLQSRRHSIDVNAKTFTGDTALHYASQNGMDEIVIGLIERGANVMASVHGWTPLHAAARNGHKSTCEILLKHGAEINAKVPWINFDVGVDEGKCPMNMAYFNQNLELTLWFIERGADTNCLFEDYSTPIHTAADQGHETILRSLLDHGAYVNSTMQGYITALHLAAEKGHLNIIKILLDANSSVDGALADGTANDGTTPMFLACQAGHMDAVKVLVDAGANVNAQLRDGASCIHVLAMKKDIVNIKYLIEKGVKIDLALKDGTTPLHYAVQGGAVDLALLLLEKGANINALSKYDWSVLHGAVMSGNIDMVTLLLNHEAHINIQLTDIPSVDKTWSGFSKWSPLHLAVKENQVNIVKLLLEKGGDVNTIDGDGKTVIDMVKSSTSVSTEMTELFKNYENSS